VGVSRDCLNFLGAPIISGTVKATGFKSGMYIYRADPNKSPLKILEKRECGRIQGLHNFGEVPPIISETGKAMDFKFGEYICRANLNKSLLKFWRKWSVGVSRDCPNFLGSHYYFRNG